MFRPNDHEMTVQVTTAQHSRRGGEPLPAVEGNVTLRGGRGEA